MFLRNVDKGASQLRGATVHIPTKSAEALQAIYDFLRFQIKEHKTGDSLEVGKS